MEKDTDMTKICQQLEINSKVKLRLILTKVEYENAQLICHKLGGKIPLPTKDKDFRDTIANEYFSDPTYSSSCRRFWLPIIQVDFLIAYIFDNSRLS